ncbi:Xanthine and CO dehydrogenases maturation factor, XdhC/CoxF family [hydrothermal vent metagenome]|uniref:Xanthine and CO dehydrogenases maturation factor, XdhC/CoxF family n=1 Tax=hydrothermal vent metagenome TaxID=652676 RepID=A0A3B0ZHC4_9ZZZZ
MSKDDLDVVVQAESWLAAGQKVVLLIVTKTLGSAPRPVGSLMAICADGAWIGSVSGGCVEQDIFELLQNRFPSKPETLRYGEHGKQASRRLMPCGGTLELIVEPLTAGSLQPVLEALHRKESIERHLELASAKVSFHPVSRQQPLRLSDGTLIRVFGSQWRLLLIGATHISRYIAEMAQGLDFDVVVCEPRIEHVDNWPMLGIEVDTSMPDDVVAERITDVQCAVVALTHDPKLDDLAMLEALPSPAFYVGVLGSTQTNAKRRVRLAALGITDSQLARLHGPVGLDIGSRTPAEIAISILSELILARKNWLDSSDG